jgi:hypothetical protein
MYDHRGKIVITPVSHGARTPPVSRVGGPWGTSPFFHQIFRLHVPAHFFGG